MQLKGQLARLRQTASDYFTEAARDTFDHGITVEDVQHLWRRLQMAAAA